MEKKQALSKKVSKKKTRDYLMDLFQRQRESKKLQKQAFRDTYPKIDEEQHGPGTAILTTNPVPQQAFGAPLTMLEGSQRWHGYLVQRTRSLFGKEIEEEDGETQETGKFSLGGGREFYPDGNGHHYPVREPTQGVTIFSLAILIQKLIAFNRDRAPIFAKALETASAEEKAETVEKIQEVRKVWKETNAILSELERGCQDPSSQPPRVFPQKEALRKNGRAQGNTQPVSL